MTRTTALARLLAEEEHIEEWTDVTVGALYGAINRLAGRRGGSVRPSGNTSLAVSAAFSLVAFLLVFALPKRVQLH